MLRTRILVLALFLALAGHFARGQTTQTLSALNQCTAPIDVSGLFTLGMQMTGTWSATLQPEVAIGGQAAVNAQVTPSTSSTAQATITANGGYVAGVAGYSSFLICVSAYVSGTVTIHFQGSKNLSTGLFGGGGVPVFPLLAPNGTAAAPSYGEASGNAGMSFGTVNGVANSIIFAQAGAAGFGYENTTTGAVLGSGGGLGWSSGNLAGGVDTNITRSAAGVLRLGTNATGNSVGRWSAAGYIVGGTTFTSSAGLNDTALTGGSTVGKFTTATLTSGSTVITMGSAATAPNGWACSGFDITHPADLVLVAPTSPTTVTVTVSAITAGDVLQFGPCLAY